MKRGSAFRILYNLYIILSLVDQPRRTKSHREELRMYLICLSLQSNDLRNVAAGGLAKLLLSGRVLSAKLFVRLLLLWYNPTTEDDVNLRHCLGVFFPVFAFASRFVFHVNSELTFIVEVSCQFLLRNCTA